MKAFGTGEYPNIDLARFKKVRFHHVESHGCAAHTLGDDGRVLDAGGLIAAHRRTPFSYKCSSIKLTRPALAVINIKARKCSSHRPPARSRTNRDINRRLWSRLRYCGLMRPSDARAFG